MNSNDREKVPLFGKWTYWYILVIMWLATLIGFFYLFTKFFS
jgi:hypothetical protein